MTPLDTKLSQLATQALAAHGLALVVARITGSGGRQTLQVLVERPDFTSATLDECTQASRTLSAQLDVADLISSRYTLEVGSAGADRPLMSIADCQRFIGRHAKFQFQTPQQFAGLKVALGAASGYLTAVEGATISLAINNRTNTIQFPFNRVRAAELAPTEDELNQLIKIANSNKSNQQ